MSSALKPLRPGLLALAVAMLPASMALSGCAMNSAVYEPSTPVAAGSYTISGAVQLPRGSAPTGGGVHALTSPPISGATILLYAAGTGGYGSQAQLLAMTTSAITGGGTFVFTQDAAHVNSPGTITSTYSCPSYSFSSPDGTTSIVKDSLL
jgi:hypothetical protein